MERVQNAPEIQHVAAPMAPNIMTTDPVMPEVGEVASRRASVRTGKGWCTAAFVAGLCLAAAPGMATDTDAASAMKGGDSFTIQQPKGVLGYVPSEQRYQQLTVKGRTAASLDRQLTNHYYRGCYLTVSPKSYMAAFNYVAPTGSQNWVYNTLPRGRSLFELGLAKDILRQHDFRLTLDVLNCAYKQRVNGQILEPTMKVWIDTSKDLRSEVAEELGTAGLKGADVDWIALRVRRYADNQRFFRSTAQFSIKDTTVSLGPGFSLSVRPNVQLMQFPYGKKVDVGLIPLLEAQGKLKMVPYGG